MKSIRGLKYWVESYDNLRSAYEDVEVLYEFAKEGEGSEEEVEEQFNALKEQVEELELKNMLSSEEDSLSAVLQITAGAGGTESCDWASMLMRMYSMWGQKNGYKIKELNFQEGDVAGVKTVTLEFTGEFAFGYLKEKMVYTDWCEFLHLIQMRSAIPRSYLCMFIPWLMNPSKYM